MLAFIKTLSLPRVGLGDWEWGTKEPEFLWLSSFLSFFSLKREGGDLAT